MKITELSARNTTEEMEQRIEQKLNELGLDTFIFKDPFSIITSVTVIQKGNVRSELNHLLCFIGQENDDLYFFTSENYRPMKTIEALYKEFSNRFEVFDNYVLPLRNNNYMNNHKEIAQSQSISHHIGRGLRLKGNIFEECYLVYLETIGIFKFEVNEFKQFKKIIDSNTGFINSCLR